MRTLIIIANCKLNLFISNLPSPLFKKEGNALNLFYRCMSVLTPPFLPHSGGFAEAKKGDVGGLQIFIEVKSQ